MHVTEHFHWKNLPQHWHDLLEVLQDRAATFGLCSNFSKMLLLQQIKSDG